MRAAIHFTLNGCEDSVTLEGTDTEHVRTQAYDYFVARGYTTPEQMELLDPWSEIIED